MVEITILEYRPRLLSSAIVIIIAIIAINFGVFSERFPESPPLFFRVLCGILGVFGLIAGIWNFTVGIRFSKAFRKFAKELKLNNGTLILPKTMRLVKAKLIVKVESVTEDLDIDVFTDTIGEPFNSNAIELEKLEYRGVVGSGYPEWIELIGYELEEFRNVCGTIGIYPLKRLNYNISLDKSVLTVSCDDAYAQVSLRLENGKIFGRVSYVKGRSRGIRIEIDARYKLTLLTPPLRVYRATLFKANESGEYEFEFELPNVEDRYLVLFTGDPRLTPRKIIKVLNLSTPAIFGIGWKKVDAVLKLVLDVPRKIDVVDVARFSLSPQ